MSTRRTKIVADRKAACDACPWRVSNQGRRTSGGWYTKKNLRRLWAGLRGGDAPGMTCHPTDPDNPPADDGSQAPEGTETKECFGALLLVAREIHVLNDCAGAPDPVKEYRRRRPKGFTKRGILAWVQRVMFGGALGEAGRLPTAVDDDPDIQHPDFAAPEKEDPDGRTP